jgi:hypothetical protein
VVLARSSQRIRTAAHVTVLCQLIAGIAMARRQHQQ